MFAHLQDRRQQSHQLGAQDQHLHQCLQSRIEQSFLTHCVIIAFRAYALSVISVIILVGSELLL